MTNFKLFKNYYTTKEEIEENKVVQLCYDPNLAKPLVVGSAVKDNKI